MTPEYQCINELSVSWGHFCKQNAESILILRNKQGAAFQILGI